METKFYKYKYGINNPGAGIEVRGSEEMSESEKSLLRQAGLDGVAKCEAWTALGSNNQINYSTHGIFRYFGKFPSTIATHLINEYTKENDYVLDPMVGSGTTALECLLLDRNCDCFDVNPLSVLLAKVKTTHIDKNKLSAGLDKIVQNYKPLSIKEYDYSPIGLKDVNHWFLPQTQDSIRGLFYLINAIEDEDERNFFTICLASSIRAVSRATTQQGRLFLDVETAKTDCLETFFKKAQKVIDALSSLPDKSGTINISIHDCAQPFDENISYDLAIIHPPYFNSYKYSSINSLELAWLQVDHALVRKNEVREFFKVGKAENVEHYVEDMMLVLQNVAKTIKKDGVMALMIGDTTIKGEYVDATKKLIDEFLQKDKQFSVEKVVLRVPKFTEASWTASQRRKSNKVGISLNDFIIIFRRMC